MDAGAIVVGGGHNGLICAAYLARAGVDTVVLESRAEVGGCASTVDALGGARVNICNCDHTMVRATPILDELDLARHGLRYLDLDPPYQAVGWNGAPSWFLFHDLERTIDSLRLSAPDDADGYRRYARAATPIARLVLELANDTPRPGTVLTRVARRRQAAGSARLLQWSRRSVGDVLRSFFSTEQVRGPMFATGPAVWGLSPESPGTGLGALGFAMRHVAPVGRPEGGSGALPAATARALAAAGGRVRTGAHVERILLEADRVVGVQLRGGEVVEAPIVVCATDPRRAFVEWLPDAPPALARLVHKYRTQPEHDGYESKVDAVISARPRWRAVDGGHAARLGLSGDAVLHPTTVVAPSLADAHAAHGLAQQGRVAERPMFLVNVPSVLDPRLAEHLPPGHDVFSLEVLWTPFALAGGWPSSPEPARWLDVAASLFEGDFRSTVVDWRVMSPPVYEQEFQMARGFAPGFAGTPLSAMLGRSPELTRYETPVSGLFLTGAGTFPGAGVWGASGRNAAAAILARGSGPRRSARLRRLRADGARRLRRSDARRTPA